MNFNLQHSTQALDEAWMGFALSLAQSARAVDEVPIGAIVVCDEKIVASAFNIKEHICHSTAHAEMLVLERAAERLGRWRLSDCTLYVTLEPCVMCAGAIVQARLKRVVYGARDPKAGGCDSLYQILADKRLNHQPQVTADVLSGPCGKILSDYFRAKRTH